jgi:hypothetical protein
MSDAAVKNRARAAGTEVHQGGDVNIDDMLASLEAAAEGTGEGEQEEGESAEGSGGGGGSAGGDKPLVI